VKIVGFELRRIAMSLVRPMRIAFGTLTDRDVLLVRTLTENGTEGWGECVAFSAPVYSPEYVQVCGEAIERFFAPAILARGDVTPPFVLEDGRLKVPQEPGIGVTVDLAFVEAITTGFRRIGAL